LGLLSYQALTVSLLLQLVAQVTQLPGQFQQQGSFGLDTALRRSSTQSLPDDELHVPLVIANRWLGYLEEVSR